MKAKAIAFEAPQSLTVRELELAPMGPRDLEVAVSFSGIGTGEREAFIARSEGEKQAAINKAQGDAAAITEMADATAQVIERIATAIRQPGGEQAVQLKLAEQAVQAYAKVAQDAKTTLIVPGNMSEVSGLIASAMQMVSTGKQAGS